MTWYVARTHVHREADVALRLADQGIETLFPFDVGWKRVGKRVRATMLPIYECYLFINVPPGRQLPQPSRVTGMLGYVKADSGELLKVPLIAISCMKDMHDNVYNGQPKEGADWPQVGDRARIKAGPFEDRLAEVARRDEGGEVEVFLEAFRRVVNVKIDRDQLEAA